MTGLRSIAGAGLVTALLFVSAVSARAGEEDRAVAQAMRALDKGDRDGAAGILEKALTQKTDSPLLNYHAGLVSYAVGDYDKAKDYFARALGQGDKRDESAAHYNTANSLFQKARELRDTDPEQAIALMKEALNYYGRAIELNNTDKDASYNYELTNKVIRVIEKQLPPPMPKPQGGGSKEKEEKKQDEQKKEQQKQEQQQQQKGDQQKDEEKKEQEKRQGEQQEEEQQKEEKKDFSGSRPEPQKETKGPEQKQAGAADKKDLSEEEARMLVANYGQEGPRLDINKDKNARDAKTLKNW